MTNIASNACLAFLINTNETSQGTHAEKLKNKITNIMPRMLFDTGDDYNFMLVPVPKQQGEDSLIMADDLYTPLWVHTLNNNCQWFNLAKCKCQINIKVDRDTLHYSIHFSDQHQCFPQNHRLE